MSRSLSEFDSDMLSLSLYISVAPNKTKWKKLKKMNLNDYVKISRVYI